MSFNMASSPTARKRIVFFLIVSGARRRDSVSHLQFHSRSLNRPQWFQYGSYRVSTSARRTFSTGAGRLFWIDDSTRTDLVSIRGLSWMFAAIYWLTSELSAYAGQKVLAVLDRCFR